MTYVLEKIERTATMKITAPAQKWDVGDAWAGSTANVVPFRGSAFLMQGDGSYITSFYDCEGNIVVCTISKNHCARFTKIENSILPFDAHRSISMGRDGRGHVWLAFGAHSDSLFFARSLSPDPLAGFGKTIEIQKSMTYPIFLENDEESGCLYLLARLGGHSAGDLFVFHVPLELEDLDEPKLHLVAGQNAAPWTAGPYTNRPVRGEDGRWYFFLVWRLPEAATLGVSTVNTGIDLLCVRDSFTRLETDAGFPLASPASSLIVDRCVAIGPGRELMNQGSAACRPGGRPIACTYWADDDGIPQYRLIHSSRASEWRATRASNFTTRFTLSRGGTLPLPHSRPELVMTEADEALVIYRSTEHGNRLMLTRLAGPEFRIEDAHHCILVDEDLGFYEPIVNHAAWEASGELVLYVQRCGQPEGDTIEARASAPAWVGRWTV